MIINPSIFNVNIYLGNYFLRLQGRYATVIALLKRLLLSGFSQGHPGDLLDGSIDIIVVQVDD